MFRRFMPRRNALRVAASTSWLLTTLPLVHLNRPVRPLVETQVPDVSGYAIGLDGDPGDWPASVANNTITTSGDPPITDGRIFVWHVPRQDPATSAQDTLYLYIAVADGDYDDNDSMVVMFGFGPNDHGIRFRRSGAADYVSSAGPSVAATVGCGGAARICIYRAALDVAWRVEAKLIPADFGMNAFVRTVQAYVKATNNNTLSTRIWPSNAMLNNQVTWEPLKFGTPVDIMLVLDLSGSMGSPACSGCRNKLPVLQDAVSLFMTLLQSVTVPADRIGVRYFSSTVTTYPASGDLVTPSNQIATDVNNQMASGMTAMGGGLQSAINKILLNAIQSRNIILFTDGMQNVNPLVDRIDDSPPAGAFHLQIAPSTQLDLSSGIAIHTIGVGATPPFTQMLSDIASKTGGNTYLTTDPDANLQPFFVNTLIKSLRDHTPQLLGYRRGTLGAKSVAEVFTSNNSSRKMVLALSWKRGDSLSFHVEKDGVDLTDAGRIVRGAFYQAFVVDVPVTVHNRTIASGGDWIMRITGAPGASYDAMAISDESVLTYEVSVGPADRAVGDPLELHARLAFGGRPISDAAVTATVLKPKRGVGTLLSVNATPAPPVGFQPEPGATAAQNKMQLLLQNPDLWRSIQPTENTITLQTRGDGNYTSSFTGTNVEGAYTVVFRLEGQRDDVGKYRRTETVSKSIHFGRPKLSASSLRAEPIGETSDGRRFRLFFRPRDRFGNYLGPDYADRIGVSLASGTVGTDKKDLVDGGYTVSLLVPRGSDPVVTVTVMDEQLYHDRLSKILSKPNAFSLHAGISLPHGSFKSTYKNGFGITAGFEHRLSNTFSLAALLGYNRFETVTTGAHLDLYHVSGSLETFLTSGPLVVFIDAGGGAYHMNPGATKAGVHAGLNIEYEVSSTLSLGGSYRLHTVFTDGEATTFSTIQGGGRLKF
jgi:hypothetical protein